MSRGDGGSIFAFIGGLAAFYLSISSHADWTWWKVLLKVLCGWWYVVWHFTFH